MVYRVYVPEDFAALYAIEETCFKPPIRWGRRYMRRLVERPNAMTWIAEQASQMVGFTIVDWTRPAGETIAYIQTLEVAAAWRGQGTGSELLRRAEDSARSTRAALIWLHVDAANYGAIRLYEERGYRLGDREEDYYAVGRAALIYVKALAAAPIDDLGAGERERARNSGRR